MIFLTFHLCSWIRLIHSQNTSLTKESFSVDVFSPYEWKWLMNEWIFLTFHVCLWIRLMSMYKAYSFNKYFVEKVIYLYKFFLSWGMNYWNILKVHVCSWIRLIYLQKDFSIWMKKAYSNFSSMHYKSSRIRLIHCHWNRKFVLSLWMNKAYSHCSRTCLKPYTFAKRIKYKGFKC